ncbi:MAG: TetR/AcrR family transcriptional regulator, partial [Christensenellaceae bacterium]|nr:TetR/AcrR family transcriptional regulator [Christensenellaceae bacterium]
MKKGELKKAEILRVAEELFYQKGYERTTIDDILEMLNLSKGGFYHHFESKEALLMSICEEKALASYEAIREAVEHCPGQCADRINAMFDKNGLWRGDRSDFLGLLIRVGYRGGNLLLREHLKRRLFELCLPIV